MYFFLGATAAASMGGNMIAQETQILFNKFQISMDSVKTSTWIVPKFKILNNFLCSRCAWDLFTAELLMASVVSLDLGLQYQDVLPDAEENNLCT